MEAIETETIADYKIEIFPDSQNESPREWDNLGTMICFHRNYNLGDKHKYSGISEAVADIIKDHCTQEEKRSFILKKSKDLAGYISRISQLRDLLKYQNNSDNDGLIDQIASWINLTPNDLPDSIGWMPLYLYDHSGITMNTSGFSCRWDSGQVGIIYCPLKKFISEGCQIKDDETELQALERYLKGEVKTYDQFLTGDIYGFKIQKVKNCNCCGQDDSEEIDSCWGFYGKEDCLAEAKAIVKARLEETNTTTN